MPTDQRGFTLVELLLAVLLLVILTAILFDGLDIVTRHLGREAGRLDRSSQVALVQTFLRTELADAQPLTTVSGTTTIIAFSGTPGRLAFVSPAVPGIAYGGLQKLSLAFSPSAAGGALELEWQPYRATVQARPGASDRALLSHLRQAVFAYFGSTAPGVPPDWHTRWQDKSDLPQLVRLSVVFADGRIMPELIVALRLSGNSQPLRSGRE